MKTPRGASLFGERYGSVRARRDAEPIQITFGVIDDGPVVVQAQGPMGADLDALSGATTLVRVNDDFHQESLSDVGNGSN